MALALASTHACSSSDPGATGAAGQSGAAGSNDGAATACFDCARAACDAQRAACVGDPGCTTYLACVEVCPVSAASGVDPACEAACPRGDTSASKAASQALLQCLNTAATGCVECGAGDAGADGSTNPVLNQQCAPTTHADVCNECMWNNCCDSMDAILGGGPATDLANCWQACTDSACEQACYAQYPDGVAGLGGWWACLTVKCMPGGECPAQTTCTACTAEHCGYEFADCEADVECHLIKQCVGWCETTDCAVACPGQHPTASPLWEKYFACVTQRCATDCV